ncbi:MAG TPA: molybdate ABC transporter substrate-binding protein [Pyrinomonadaceae bacterium]|nr:molybdate ABC transporter substrate-binding protein [Pyrinomonadaceae bacterium]
MKLRRFLALESNLKNVPHSLAVSFLLLVLVFGSACRDTTAPAGAEITVAAASDLTPAFEEIGREFQASHGTKVVFVFGSTGLLTRQIENGAPFDVFAAANVGFIDQLDQKGFVVPGTKRIYGRGRITLWTMPNSPLQIEKIEDLTRADIARIAIANPDHAPYGQAAREALESAGIWDAVRSKLVYGDNIRQTLQYAETGNVEVTIVALSLSVQSQGRWVLVPEELHKPLDQGMGVIKGTKNEQAARAFNDFVNGNKGREIMTKYGFAFP